MPLRSANTLFKTYRYDPTGELRNTLHSHHGTRSFAYDTTGRIEQQTRINRQGEPNYEFMRYDPAGNVLDAFDNRLTLNAGFVANTDASRGYVRDNLVRVYQDCRYRYDPLGRLLEKRKGPHTVQRFEWDELDQLVAVHTTRHPNTPQQTQQTTRFTYDAIGRRITKQDAFGETTFIWEGMRLIEERRKAQVISYVYEPGSYVPLARIDAVGERLGDEAGSVAGSVVGDGASRVHQGKLGEPAASTSDDSTPSSTPIRAGQGQGELSTQADNPFRQDLANPYGKNLSPQQRLQASAQIFHFHNTPNGLPEELSDAQGDIRWQATYATWGNTQTESWQLTQLSGQPVPHQRATPLPLGHESQIQQNLRFQGQYLDRDTGLHYNTFRFYDPDIGRFISPDPIGLAGGVNLHSYAPNPISWIDPWGWEGHGVSANTALPDVLSRGIHVNVEVPGSKPIHVGLRPDHQGGIKLVPADPKAKAILQKNPSLWGKITSSVNSWLDQRLNREKLVSTANAAKTTFPNKGAEFAHLERNLKKGGCQ